MSSEEIKPRLRAKPVPTGEWEWYGMAAHFICGRWCRFHMATKIGHYAISSVGFYVPPHRSGSNERTEAEWLKANPLGDDIGCDRKFETMVFGFKAYCDSLECNCGTPIIDASIEYDFAAANSIREARENHMKLCKKWAHYV